MLQISEIVRKTEEMFDLFNEHFYEGELNRPAITVSPDGGRGAYGWCSINEIWNASGEKYREINLCAEYLDRPIFELAATLLGAVQIRILFLLRVVSLQQCGSSALRSQDLTAFAYKLVKSRHWFSPFLMMNIGCFPTFLPHYPCVGRATVI